MKAVVKIIKSERVSVSYSRQRDGVAEYRKRKGKDLRRLRGIWGKEKVI